jgi:limonene-1,2-epoxide hydrolase
MNRRMAVAGALLAGTLAVSPACLAKDRAVQTIEVSTAMAFLGALGRLDFDAAGQFLEEDASLELPFAGEGLTVRGRQEILQFFRKSMGKSTAAIEYNLDRAYPSPEAGALVLEISTRARTATGRGYTNRLVAIFEFRGEKISLFREYFNPMPLG